jgi:hypothetical protein
VLSALKNLNTNKTQKSSSNLFNINLDNDMICDMDNEEKKRPSINESPDAIGLDNKSRLTEDKKQIKPAIEFGDQFLKTAMIDEYLEQFPNETEQKLFEKMIENIKVVDKETFDEGIDYLAEQILQTLAEKGRKRCLLLIDGAEAKSGSLMLEKLLPLLEDKIKVEVIDYAYYGSRNPWVGSFSKEWSDTIKRKTSFFKKFFIKDIFVVDDAGYSGNRIERMCKAAQQLNIANVHAKLVGATGTTKKTLAEMGVDLGYYVDLQAVNEVFDLDEYDQLVKMLSKGTQQSFPRPSVSTLNFLYYKVPDVFPPGLLNSSPFRINENKKIYLIDDTKDGVWPPYYGDHLPFFEKYLKELDNIF